MAKFYLVGGAVRDKLRGKASKDFDYTVEAESYEAMRAAILERKGEIYLETPQFLTIRAKVPLLGAADYVLARKESHYTDGRHPDNVVIGSLYDDLARRDFTMNAIAQDEDGNYIDPHGGREDIENRLIRCVGNPYERFNEDRLRLLRAIRFAVVLDFDFEDDTEEVIDELVNRPGAFDGVSLERIREELTKAFKYNTLRTLGVLDHFNIVRHPGLFSDLWLKPTSEQ